MKRIHIVLEALDYNYLQNVKPPNIMKLDPHPAVTWGLGSRPATGAFLGGMLPICQIPNCYHRKIELNWCNPFFLTIMKQKTEKLFLLCANGWSLELALPWIDKEQIKKNLEWIKFKPNQLAAEDMTTYFLEKQRKYKSYYAYIHFFETHYPFHAPNLPRNGKHRKEALLYVDEQVGRILKECEDAYIVISSDHNLPPRIVSAAFDVPAPQTMLSFIATNFKEIPKTFEGNHIEFAESIWLNR